MCEGGGGEEGGGCSVSAAAVIHSAENTDEFSGGLQKTVNGTSNQDGYAVHSRKVSSYTGILLTVTIVLGQRETHVKYFFFIQRRTCVPVMNYKQRSNNCPYKRFTV